METQTSLVEPLIITPLPDEVPGAWYDPDAVDRVVRFFANLTHTIGKRWAGAAFTLDPWQFKYVVSPIFGWKNAEGNRIIRTAWIEVPRKNGKTTVSAGLGLYLTVSDREPGAQVFAAAGAKDQANLVFTPAKQMCEGSELLRPVTKRLGSVIHYPKNNSVFRVVASDGDLQHGLNVHGAVIDEVHVHKKRDLIDALETGTGSRDQPLIIFITTADDSDQTSVYAEKRSYLEGVANRTIIDPSFYGVVFGADEEADPFSEETLRKANPGAGTTVNWDYLKQKAAEAQTSPGALNRYKRLHLNIRTRATTAWLDPRAWDESAGIVLEPELKHTHKCYLGVDLAGTSDFTATALVFPQDDGFVDVVMRFWLPRAAVNRRKDFAPTLERWAKEGFLTITDGDVMDEDTIRHGIEQLASDFRIVAGAYDPWNAIFMPNLVEAGLNAEPLMQTTPKLNAPSKLLERLVGERRLRHGGNPVLRWMAGNVMVFTDSQGNIKPDRKNSNEKIDGIAALVDGLAAWLWDEGESVYEDRGLVVL